MILVQVHRLAVEIVDRHAGALAPTASPASCAVAGVAAGSGEQQACESDPPHSTLPILTK